MYRVWYSRYGLAYAIDRILMYAVLKMINVYVQQAARIAEYLLKLDPPVEYICVSFAQKGQKWSSAVSVFCCSFFWVVNWGQFVDSKYVMHISISCPYIRQTGFCRFWILPSQNSLVPGWDGEYPAMPSAQVCMWWTAQLTFDLAIL